MTRCVMRLGDKITEADELTGRVETIDRRRLLDLQAEHPRVKGRLVVQRQIVAMEVNGNAKRAFRLADAGDMIEVGVRQQDRGQCDPFASRKLEQRLDLVARINEHAFPRPGAGHDKAVLEQRAYGLRLDYDHNVILAILDDLLFTSKMRATAKQVGATLAVAKSREAALAEMRANAPALVIFDLNNPRTDPLGIVTEMKADPALAGIHTVGFVSHVHTELIDAARKAGVGDVMARSMFAERLPQIFAKGLLP